MCRGSGACLSLNPFGFHCLVMRSSLMMVPAGEQAKAVKSLANLMILVEEYSARYMEVLVQSMAAVSETVRAQAYTSGSTVAAQWPALPNGMSERALCAVGAAATSGAGPRLLRCQMGLLRQGTVLVKLST